MAHQDLVLYIKSSRAAGMTDDQIREELVRAGWRRDQIDAAFAALAQGNGDNAASPRPSEQPLHTPSFSPDLRPHHSSPWRVLTIALLAAVVLGGSFYAVLRFAPPASTLFSSLASKKSSTMLSPSKKQPPASTGEKSSHAAKTQTQHQDITLQDSKLSTIPEGAKVVSRFLLSPDAQHVMYVIEKDGKQHMMIDDEMGPGYDEVFLLDGYSYSLQNKWLPYIPSIGWSPDSSRYVYIAREGEDDFVVTKDRTYGPYSAHSIQAVVIGRKKLWLQVSSGGKLITREITDNGEKMYSGVRFYSPFALSSHDDIAFTASAEEDSRRGPSSFHVWYNGELLSPAYDGISEISFGESNDGPLIYVGQRRKFLGGGHDDYLHIGTGKKPVVAADEIFLSYIPSFTSIYKTYRKSIGVFYDISPYCLPRAGDVPYLHQLFIACGVTFPLKGEKDVSSGDYIYYGYGNAREIAGGNTGSLSLKLRPRGPYISVLRDANGEIRKLEVYGVDGKAVKIPPSEEIVVNDRRIEMNYNKDGTEIFFYTVGIDENQKRRVSAVYLVDSEGVRRYSYPNPPLTSRDVLGIGFLGGEVPYVYLGRDRLLYYLKEGKWVKKAWNGVFFAPDIENTFPIPPFLLSEHQFGENDYSFQFGEDFLPSEKGIAVYRLGTFIIPKGFITRPYGGPRKKLKWSLSRYTFGFLSLEGNEIWRRVVDVRKDFDVTRVWKRYRNERYGYELFIPPGWSSWKKHSYQGDEE
ncbi:hypothetical protein D6779_02450, partial [Candidatus Parcubacteria bacterium]